VDVGQVDVLLSADDRQEQLAVACEVVKQVLLRGTDEQFLPVLMQEIVYPHFNCEVANFVRALAERAQQVEKGSPLLNCEIFASH
jgi:hypothetical protein